jgi:uncharacterized damage-inducible protein DinB
MDIQTLYFFANYNLAVNQKMNAHIDTLSDDQWNRRFSGYFNSIRSMCNHIYTCDFNWLKRFSQLRSFSFIEGTEIENGLEYGKMHIGTIQDYRVKREWLDTKILEFVAEIEEKDIQAILKYVDSHGTTYQNNFGLLVLHMFNHETHHRGMISLYLEEMGIENDYSNIYDLI